MAQRGHAPQVEVKQHPGGHERRRRRDGQAIEIVGVDGTGLEIEVGQPQGAAGHEEEGRNPAEAAEALQGPQGDQERRGHPEGHQVGQRIILDAKARGGLGRRASRPSRPSSTMATRMARAAASTAVNGGDDGEETGKQAGRGDEVGD